MVECNAVCDLFDDNLLTKYLIKKFEGIDIDITNGLVEIYAKTNIKKVNPIIYKIKYRGERTTILYYKIDDIKDKKYYIVKERKDYNLSDLKSYFEELYR